MRYCGADVFTTLSLRAMTGDSHRHLMCQYQELFTDPFTFVHGSGVLVEVLKEIDPPDECAALTTPTASRAFS